jgi:hypothetical protein
MARPDRRFLEARQDVITGVEEIHLCPQDAHDAATVDHAARDLRTIRRRASFVARRRRHESQMTDWIPRRRHNQ